MKLNKLSILISAFFLVSINSTTLFAQHGAEFGFGAGVSYYMGDINLHRQFYNPKPNLTGFLKYHFNSRNILKISVAFTHLSAKDADFNNIYQQQRNKKFDTPLIEIAAQTEVNFLPFLIGETKRNNFSPYLNLGLALYIANNSTKKIGLAVPVGLGIKVNVLPRIVLGLEWSFRKCFSDYLDSLSGEDLNNYDSSYGTLINSDNILKQSGFRYNKDWYSFANITVSYTFKLGGLGCPAYYHQY